MFDLVNLFSNFNPRPREGDDSPAESRRRVMSLNFNPRPREGDDRNASASSSILSISIHVPARGTTIDTDEISAGLQFQSTSPRGGRPYSAKWSVTGCQFQSTSPRGGRQRLKEWYVSYTTFQSTSPRGGRLLIPTSWRGIRYFNPRPREGDDFNVRVSRCM